MKPPRLLTTVLGAVAVLSLVAVDPAAVVLLLDVELLSLLGSAGVLLTVEQARTWVHHRVALVRCAPSVVIFVAGVRLAREEPRSVLA
jgi:hypothetical protein